MRILLLTASFLFLSVVAFSQEGSSKSGAFPTNFDSSQVESLASFNGKIIAFDGQIKEIRNSRNNTPFYKLELGKGQILWTALMFINEANKLMDTIRVVGYLRTNKDLREDETFLESHEFMVLAFGLVDFENSNILFLNGADVQKKEWMNGRIPSSGE
jgi:hypothetical protein